MVHFWLVVRDRGLTPEAAVQSIAKQFGRVRPEGIEDIRRQVGAPAPPDGSQSTERI